MLDAAAAFFLPGDVLVGENYPVSIRGDQGPAVVPHLLEDDALSESVARVEPHEDVPTARGERVRATHFLVLAPNQFCVGAGQFLDLEGLALERFWGRPGRGFRRFGVGGRVAARTGGVGNAGREDRRHRQDAEARNDSVGEGLDVVFSHRIGNVGRTGEPPP